MYGPRPIRFSAHWCADYSKYRGFLAGGISTASSILPFFETRLRRQNFNLAPTQYRQLRRLFPSRPVNLTVVTGWAIRGSLPSRGRRLRFKPQIITMKNIVLPYDYSKPKKEKMLMVLAKFFQKWKIGSSTLVSLNWTVWWKMIFVNIRFHMTETLPLWCSRGN